MIKKTASFLILFLIILAYFIFAHGWYEPAKLVIRGTANQNSSVSVQWDSGAGYNPYETRKFSFLPFRGDADENLTLIIERGADKNRSSRGNRVVLIELRIDDKGKSIPQSALTDVRLIPGHGWSFESTESKIKLNFPAHQRISIAFKTSWGSGVANISINDQKTSHDLYRRNWEILFSHVNFWLLDENGKFTLSFDLPRYAIDSLQIGGTHNARFSSVQLKTQDGEIDLPFDNSQSDTISVLAPNKELKRYFHPAHLLIQILSALFVTTLAVVLVRKMQDYGGLKEMFAAGRWVFWLFLGGALLVYSIWVMAFWPGIMSVDSLNIWRAALLPEVMINNHPFVNELWYLFLSLIWCNIAIVPITHTILLSVLVAAIFFYVHRLGVTLWLLGPVYLLLLFSIPVGLYNATLWKDVPFALLVVLWSIIPVYLYIKKRVGEPVDISILTGILLLLSFFSLLTFRHNGLIYLIVIPSLFVALRLVRISKIVAVSGFIAGACVCFLIIFPPHGLRSASYFHDLSRVYIEQIGNESIVKRVADSVKNYPRLLDIKKHQDSSDFWHYYLKDRHAYKFLKEVGWNDVYRYVPPEKYAFPELRKIALKIYRASLDYPWLYLSWYPFILLYLFPLSLLLCRWFPLSAIFSTVILAQIVALLFFVGTTNWRYYYFVLLGGYFLLPIILLDFRFLKEKKAGG